MLHIVGSVRATVPVRCYWASFFCLNNENKVTLWICRWWRTSFVSSCSWRWSHFSRNSSISGWFNRARQRSRWIFITNKWTSEIGDNSASIHGPFHRNRVTRKDTSIDYRSNHSYAGRTWSWDNASWTGDEKTIVSNQQSMLALCDMATWSKTINVIAPIVIYAYCAIKFALLSKS